MPKTTGGFLLWDSSMRNSKGGTGRSRRLQRGESVELATSVYVRVEAGTPKSVVEKTIGALQAYAAEMGAGEDVPVSVYQAEDGHLVLTASLAPSFTLDV